MKNRWPLCAVVVLLCGCDDVRLEPRFKFVPRFGERTAAEKAQEELDGRLAELDRQLERLQRDVDATTGDAKHGLEDQLAALKRQRRGLEDGLRDASRAGEQALEDAKRATGDVLKELERELKKLDQQVTSSR